MKLDEIEEAVREVMGKDPIEMCIRYYEGLIQLSRNCIAEEQKHIQDFENRIAELAQNPKEAKHE